MFLDEKRKEVNHIDQNSREQRSQGNISPYLPTLTPFTLKAQSQNVLLIEETAYIVNQTLLPHSRSKKAPSSNWIPTIHR